MGQIEQMGRIEVEAKQQAEWEVEVRTPLHMKNGELVDLDLAPSIISEVGHCSFTGAGFGERDAGGDAGFSSPKEAYDWKVEKQTYLETIFDKLDPEVFVGIWIDDPDDENERHYFELELHDGEYRFVADLGNGQEYLLWEDLEIEDCFFTPEDVALIELEKDLITKNWGQQ